MKPIDQTKIPEVVRQKYLLENETFSRDVKEDPKDRIQIEIGDLKQLDFKPQFKIMRWDNEVNFSMRAEEHPGASVDFDGEVIKYITPDYEVHQYDKPDAGEDGGFEFEWYLPKKPLSNILTASIQTKGLRFLYQPQLSQEQIDLGEVRSEKVEGSYAVYHQDKGGYNNANGKKYKSGKVFHIYRPKAIDSVGNEAWCNINIDEPNNLLTVEIPLDFINTATFPLLVDPTFGYTSVGASNANTNFDIVQGVIFNLASNADTVVSLTGYFRCYNQTRNIKGLVYDVSSNYPSTLNLTSDIGKVTQDTDWVDLLFSSDPSLSSGDYYLGWVGDTSTLNIWGQLYYDTDASVYSYETAKTAGYYTTPPSTYPSSRSDTNKKYSLYITYTSGTKTTAQVAASDEDYSRDPSGSYFDSTVTDWGAGSPFGNRNSGALFKSISVPAGATINYAYLEVVARDTDANNTANTDLYMEDVDSATKCTSYTDFDSRTRTTATVAWDGIPYWEADSIYISPDISSLVQEVVDRAGWASGQNMQLFWQDDGSSTNGRVAKSYDSSSSEAPKLVIYYTSSDISVDASDSLTISEYSEIGKSLSILINTNDSPVRLS